jgi:hypothetical protein
MCRENKTGGILIKGLAKEGHLDKFLLQAIKDKIKTMKSNSRSQTFSKFKIIYPRPYTLPSRP